MRPFGAPLACTFVVGVLLLLVGCDQGSPTAPTPAPGPSPVPAPPVEWTVASGGNGHHYQLSVTLGNAADHFLSWTQAKVRAEGLSFRGVSGHLATSTSPAENSFIVQRVVPASRTPAPLLGGFQPPGSPEPAGGWQWVTGEPFSYTNWAPLEPNEAVPGADFLVFTADPEPTIGTWNDVADVVSAYIIEFDTTPPAPIHQSSSFLANPSSTVNVSPFDPAQGALDRVDVSISGTLTVFVVTQPNPAGPFGAPLPYTFNVTLTQDFSGSAGKYFDFSPPAEFRFTMLPATGSGEMQTIVTNFTYTFSLTNATDLVGFTFPMTASSFGSLIPPAAGALGTRADFLLTPPPIDLVLIAQTWRVIGSTGPVPVISSARAQGALAFTYHYTPVP